MLLQEWKSSKKEVWFLHKTKDRSFFSGYIKDYHIDAQIIDFERCSFYKGPRTKNPKEAGQVMVYLRELAFVTDSKDAIIEFAKAFEYD